MSAYEDIDPALNKWAEENGLTWERNYKDSEVRTVWWPLNGSGNVQIWVESPQGDNVAVHASVNSQMSKNRRRWERICQRSELVDGLDDALKTAVNWKSEFYA